MVKGLVRGFHKEISAFGWTFYEKIIFYLNFVSSFKFFYQICEYKFSQEKNWKFIALKLISNYLVQRCLSTLLDGSYYLYNIIDIIEITADCDEYRY